MSVITSQIPVGLKGAQYVLALTTTPTVVFDNPAIPGRYMFIMLNNTTFIGAIDIFVGADGTALVVKAYGVYGRTNDTMFPVTYSLPANPSLDPSGNMMAVSFSISGGVISVNSVLGTINPFVIRTLIISQIYSGANLYSVDQIEENTPGSGTTFLTQLISTHGITINGNTMNIGNNAEDYAINLGTNSNIGRSITIGDAKSAVVINGNLTLPKLTGSISYVNTTPFTWTDVGSTVVQVGDAVTVYINSTVVVTTSPVISVTTLYQALNIPASFGTSQPVTGTISFTTGSNTYSINILKKVSVTTTFYIYPSVVLAAGTYTAAGSVTFLK